MPTTFQSLEAELLFPLIPESGSFAVDVGANEGFWSRELATRFEWVHAYEPQPGITAAPENVLVLNAALGDHVGMTEMRLYGNSEVATMADRPDVGYGPQRGSLVTPIQMLDKYAGGGPVDFIKIDVEGAEVAVIRGASRLLRLQDPELLIESHSLAASRWLLMTLADAGYKTRVIPNPTPGADDYCWIHAR